MLYYATHDAWRRRRHPGHRQPQPGRLQRLQDAAERPLGLRRGDPEARPHRRRRRMERRPRLRHRRRTSSTPMSTAWSGTSTAAASASAGTPATAPPGRSAREAASQKLPGEHFTLSTPRSTAPSPTTIPTRRSKPISPTSRSWSSPRKTSTSASPSTATATASARSTAGPGHLGRPIDDDPRRAGARTPARARRSSPTSRPARPCSTASPNWAASP